MLDGLPCVSRSTRAIASATSGSTGVVAAWSRYTRSISESLLPPGDTGPDARDVDRRDRHCRGLYTASRRRLAVRLAIAGIVAAHHLLGAGPIPLGLAVHGFRRRLGGHHMAGGRPVHGDGRRNRPQNF